MEGTEGSRAEAGARGGFPVPSTRSNAAEPRPLGLSAHPEWRVADVENPARLQEMLHDSISQLVAASPAMSAIPPDGRAAVERILANDPTVRALLTEHLAQSLA